MTRWFRLYSDAIRNPKVARLSDADFRLWVELLSVAADNDGLIPPLEDLKHLLKRRSDHLLLALNRLAKGGLIDASGDGFEPHNWRKFQYKSDTSTERVKRFRQGKRNVSETAPDTEADTDVPLGKPNGPAADPKKAFWDSALAYLGQAKRSQVGKWSRDYGQEQTAAAITAAQIAGAVDPIPYIERTLRGATREAVFSGPC